MLLERCSSVSSLCAASISFFLPKDNFLGLDAAPLKNAKNTDLSSEDNSSCNVLLIPACANLVNNSLCEILSSRANSLIVILVPYS